VQVPLGVRVTDPVTLAIDEGTPESFTLQGCTANGCFAGGPAAQALLDRLRGGQTIRISFLNLGGDTVAVTMPLRGFAVAHDKIR
jgi:invasion protein IalB